MKKMPFPYKCPVCDGMTTIFIPWYMEIKESSAKDVLDYYRTCPACNGTGIVWEPVPTDK